MSSTLPRSGAESALQKDINSIYNHKLRKSASFSSSSATSLGGSSSLGSATSTTSLRSSPMRTGSSTRTLKSDKINTFQKWETTIESVSYVTTKTVAIADPANRPRSSSVSQQLPTAPRSRSTTPNMKATTNGWTSDSAEAGVLKEPRQTAV